MNAVILKELFNLLLCHITWYVTQHQLHYFFKLNLQCCFHLTVLATILAEAVVVLHMYSRHTATAIATANSSN